MVFTCFYFECRYKVSVFFVFNTDHTVNISLYTISVGVKFLLSCYKVVILYAKLIFIALKDQVKPLSDIFNTSLRILNYFFLFFAETVQQK